jgi:hypothetical protein
VRSSDGFSGLGSFVGSATRLRARAGSLQAGPSHWGFAAPTETRFEPAETRRDLVIFWFAFISPVAWQRGLDIRRPTLRESCSQVSNLLSDWVREFWDMKLKIITMLM